MSNRSVLSSRSTSSSSILVTVSDDTSSSSGNSAVKSSSSDSSTTELPINAQARKRVQTTVGLLQEPAELATVEEVLDHFAKQANGQAIRQLGKCLGLKSDEKLDQFEQDFKSVMKSLDPESGEGIKLTKAEQKAADKLAAYVTNARASAPALRGKVGQFWNSFRTASIAFGCGFGAVVLAVRIAGMVGMGGPANLVVAAGGIIMFAGEILAGQYRAQGPGYPAADNAAYLQHNSLQADRWRNFHEAQGVAARYDLDLSDNRDDPRIKPYIEKDDALALKEQQIVVGLIQQEFGHQLGMKNSHAIRDVPVAFRSGLTSKYATDFGLNPDDNDSDNIEGARKPKGQYILSLPDGTELFSVVPRVDEEDGRFPPRSNWPKNSFPVTWPDGTQTDLMKDLVPEEYCAPMEKAVRCLLCAARLRAAVCEEAPYGVFGAWYMISGSLGPPVSAAVGGGPAGFAADMAISLPITFLATQSLIHTQNAVRSEIAGAVLSLGTKTPERTAKATQARFEVKRLEVWADTLKKMKKEIKAGLAELRVRAIEDESTEIEESITAHEEALQRISAAKKECVKAYVAAEQKLTRLRTKAGGMGEGWKDQMRSYVGNPTQLVSKFFGYTQGYILYTQAFVPGIATLKTGGSLAAYYGLASLTGFAMLTGFVFRNQIYASAGELMLKSVAGKISYAKDRAAKAAPGLAHAAGVATEAISARAAVAAGKLSSAASAVATMLWSCCPPADEIYVDIEEDVVVPPAQPGTVIAEQSGDDDEGDDVLSVGRGANRPQLHSVEVRELDDDDDGDSGSSAPMDGHESS